jgi:aspartyl-tRNA(Asn)/glutamyl-tRNA(Gln) amidotransferase subunit C
VGRERQPSPRSLSLRAWRGGGARGNFRGGMADKKIDRARVMHIAKLAALSLRDEEADALAADLARIVAYVEELDTVDTKDVPPTAHVQLGRAKLRPDETKPCLPHDEALAAAPRTEHGGFAVPAFVES